ncbi:TetR/AcrR family transcriptional regulator [Actinomadura graeca]|uniref:TetR/AcrR family transcriptional regulator n=1 Tax=Actinomadura graeca TaxID=2750812 RepID=UPI001E450267|nr:TetR/AcrR family transcriptional regulator [Actinomadura graeca]
MTAEQPVPRRADALRNRTRIMEAALDAFSSDGRLVPLDEIARRAGVGAGTVYRNFPTKEALFTAVITDRFLRIVEEARALADSGEPVDAFYGFVTWVVERAMVNHALCEALALDVDTAAAFDHRCVDKDFTVALAVLLRRAQEAGGVRDDVDVADVRALLVGCMIMERRRRTAGPPGRMTALACDALRPPGGAAPPPHVRNETKPMSRNGTTICAVCGTPLAVARTGRPARYCGPTCRQTAHRRRHRAKSD